jgi:beta-lactamase class A
MAMMLDAPALPPPVVVAPAPREVSFGLVSGRAPLGTRKIIVHVGRYVAAEEPLRGRSFSLHVRLTGGPTTIRVTAVDGRERRSSSVVESVYGLPPDSEPRERAPRLDAALSRTIRSLVAGHGGTSAVYVQDLRTGRGAAWNARARFPAGSTLKLAIAVTVLRSLDRKPEPITQVSRLLGKMLVSSDNDAANALEVWLGGSTSAGSDRVNATMRALGLSDSLMYGGYETARRAAAATTPIPVRVESQPAFGVGKYTTAADLSRLARTVYLAAAGRGPLLRLGVTASEARYLLWLLAQVTDRGKLDRFLRGPVVMHKAGWLTGSRHDNGIVAYDGGAFVATVMTWHAGAADELAGQVALSSFARFAG